MACPLAKEWLSGLALISLVLLFAETAIAFSPPPYAGAAFVHLFEWSWSDVAIECETFLGPKGVAAVQISPPQEHIAGSQWWTRYQPVSYQLTSRSGNEAEFIDMVKRCASAGVDIYADAVINVSTHICFLACLESLP